MDYRAPRLVLFAALSYTGPVRAAQIVAVIVDMSVHVCGSVFLIDRTLRWSQSLPSLDCPGGTGMRLARKHHQHHMKGWPRVGLLLVLALVGLVAASALQSPRAQAAGSGPIIHWDSSTIYPGQNNGFPWGPVGEIVTVHGEKFLDAAVLGQPVNLALIAGDVNNPPGGDSSYSFCKLAGPKVAVGQATVDGSGNFDFTFTWPAAAGSGNYSICAYNTLDGLPAGNIDDGPFAVLAASAPSVSVSRSSVGVGEKITVTGKNWVPPQDVNVYIAACVDCDGPVIVAGTAHSGGLNTGTFSITFTIPGNATLGDYVAGANAHSVLDVGPTGGKPVKITAAAPTPTTAPTATVAPTPTSSGNAGAGNGNTDNGNSTGSQNTSPLLFVAIGVGLLLLILAILLVVLLARRGANPASPGAAGGPASGFPSPGPGAGGYPAYGGDPLPSAGGASVQQNWQTLPPGWGDQTPPTVVQGMPQGDDSPTQVNISHMVDPNLYPPAPPASYPPPGGDTPTQPGIYGDASPKPYDPHGG